MNPMSVRRRLAVPMGFAVVLLLVVLCYQFWSGIRVRVTNNGNTPLKSVVLHVTGASYSLGDIAFGASSTARVAPTGESTLFIEITDDNGETQRIDAGGYFEPGYWVAIRVDIRDGIVERFEEHKPWRFVL